MASEDEEFRSELEYLKGNVRELDDGLCTVKQRLDDLENRHARYCQHVKENVAQKTALPLTMPPAQPPPPPPPRPDAKHTEEVVMEVRQLHFQPHGTQDDWKPAIETIEEVVRGAAPGAQVAAEDFAHLNMNDILAAANINDVGHARFKTPPKDSRVEITEETTTENGHTVTKRVYVTERFTATTMNGETHSTTTNGTMPHPKIQVIGLKKNKGDNHLVSTAYCARVSHVSSDPVIAFLQGLSVRQENGQLIIDRITDESPVAKKGLLHVGDSILEVNGKEVRTPEELKAELHNQEGVSLKVVPSGLESSPIINGVSEAQDYVRCCYDYDPSQDDQIPSKSIGLTFKVGDILQILGKDESDWWQARKVNDWSCIGLVPSQAFEERRKAAATGQTIDPKKAKKIMYNVKNSAIFDENDILCYEEVGKLSPYGRRVLILIGAPGVGRRTLKARLLQHDPENFATVTPYTSRKPRDSEQEGREYHFYSREQMQKDIDQGNFLEWGEFNNNFYGTRIDSVRKIIRSGRVCVLDCSPQAIKYLYNSEFMPYIAFIAPPPFEEFKQLYQIHPSRTKPKTDEDMKRISEDAVIMESSFRHVFDLALVNRNAEVTFRRLVDALESLKSQPQWVPVSWLYS